MKTAATDGDATERASAAAETLSGCGSVSQSVSLQSRCSWSSVSPGWNETMMSAEWRCGRIQRSESGSRRSSSESTWSVVYPRREQSRCTFQWRRSSSGGSRYTRTSKLSDSSRLWNPSSPSQTRNLPGTRYSGGPNVPSACW